MKKNFWVLLSVLLASLIAGPASAADLVKFAGAYVSPDSVASMAEEAQETPITSQEFGIVDQTTFNLGPCEMMPRSATDFTRVDILNCSSVGVLSGEASVSVGAEVHLPTGALITDFTVFYNDTHTTSNPSMGLWRSSTTGVNTGIQFFDPAAAFSGGDTSSTVPLATPHTVDNTTNRYHFLIILARSVAIPAEQERVYRVAIKYRRQISPAPAVATFTDVPTTHGFFQAIEALVASGITVGIGGGNYGPDQTVTRGQMAAFLARALGLHWPN
jgi:hypothetical protein